MNHHKKINRAKSNPKPFPSPRHDNKMPAPIRPSFAGSSLLQSTNFTPREVKHERSVSSSDSELSGSQASKIELLNMEIKQLKRENQFLKKKIQEMTQPQIQPRKKNSKLQTQPDQAKIDPVHLNLNYFFRQIAGLLNSVSTIFHLQSPPSQMHDLQHLPCESNPHQIKKACFSRKLQTLMMQPEQTKYRDLLAIFTEYYTFKEQNQKDLLSGLQHQLAKVKQLNQWLLQKAQNKKTKISGINCPSQKQNTTVGEQQKQIDNLKVPESEPSHPPRLSFSPNNANTRTKYKRNVDISP